MELISEITFGLNSTPIKYSNNIKKNYQRVTSDGVYNFEDQIYLYSLNEKGKPGYNVITPFKTINNENVLSRHQVMENLVPYVREEIKKGPLKLELCKISQSFSWYSFRGVE